MVEEQEQAQPRLLYVNLDDFIPEDHLLRRIKKNVSFKFVRDKVRHLYSDKGRPSIDPIRLVKMWLIGYLYGISSERRLEEEIRLNLAYRWFLDLQLDERIPDHSTLSRNRNERFAGTALFEEIFEEIVQQCKTAGVVQGEAVVTDSTHIRANASEKKRETVTVTKTPRQYLAELQSEAEAVDAANRQARGGGKKSGRKPGPNTPNLHERVQYTTDPDAGKLGRPGKPEGPHYLAHVTIDPTHGIILDTDVTPADICDHEPYVECVRRAKRRCDTICEAAADAGYDFAEVHKGLHDLGVTSYIPDVERRSGSDSGKRFTVRDFVYDKSTDSFICPAGKTLAFTHIASYGLKRVYAAKTADCKACPLREQCVPSSRRFRQLKRPFLQDHMDLAHARTRSRRYRELQRKRSVWCEGTFAALKARHCFGRAIRRGLEKMREQVLMASTAMNILRMVRALA
jgi:transposase